MNRDSKRRDESPCEECPIRENLGYCPIMAPGIRYCPYLGIDIE